MNWFCEDCREVDISIKEPAFVDDFMMDCNAEEHGQDICASVNANIFVDDSREFWVWCRGYEGIVHVDYPY